MLHSSYCTAFLFLFYFIMYDIMLHMKIDYIYTVRYYVICNMLIKIMLNVRSTVRTVCSKKQNEKITVATALRAVRLSLRIATAASTVALGAGQGWPCARS